MEALLRCVFMGIKGGPDIVTDGLVFNLDAAGAVSDKGYDPEGLRVHYLIVGGGGGSAKGFSAHACSGGGGAGAFREGFLKVSMGQSYTVVIGGGGVRSAATGCGRGSNGADSSIFSLTSNGGAGAGTWCSLSPYGLMAGTSNGNASGSGSGGAGVSTANTGGSGGEFGNDGGSHTGTGNSNSSTSSGGGGGAGGPGGNGVASQLGGDGGIGKSSNISGNGVFYAGGGAGGSSRGVDNGGGGRGGGGDRGSPTLGAANPGENGLANTGGGGGGSSAGGGSAFGGSGGSGIVILRYKGKQKATGGDSIVYKNGYTIHTFTSSGSFVLDETVDDLSTSKIVGTLENMDSTNYNIGNKGYFSLSTDEYIDLNRGLSSIGSEATIETFFRSTAPEGTDPFCVILGWGDGNDYYSQFGIGNWGSFSSSESIFIGVASQNVIIAENGGQAKYHDGQWYQAVATLGANNYRIYVNGEQKTTTLHFGSTSYNPSNLFNFSSGTVSRIGNRPYGGGSGYFNGHIAFVKVYNRILSLNEILDNYNATKGRFGL